MAINASSAAPILQSLVSKIDISWILYDSNKKAYDSINVTSMAADIGLSVSRLDEILSFYVQFQLNNWYLTTWMMYKQTVMGVFGLISYVLMLCTFIKIRDVLSPCTTIYYVALVILEMPHMVIMIAFGFMIAHQDDDDGSSSAYRQNRAFCSWLFLFNNGWTIGDSVKLAMSTLSMFITVERFVAVCFPIQFKRINRPIVAIGAILLSLLIGSAHMWLTLSKELVMVDAPGKCNKVSNWLSKTTFFSFTVKVTEISRFVQGGVVFVLSIAKIVVMRKRLAKITGMTAQASLAEEQRKTWMICTMSFITGAVLLVDHIFWGMYRIMSDGDRDYSNVYAIVHNRTYEEVRGIMSLGTLYMASYHAQDLAGNFLHGFRFCLFLAFNRTFRNGFLSLIKRQNDEVVFIGGTNRQA